MKMQVSFEADGWVSVDVESSEVGLEFLDRVRRDLGVSSLSMDRVRGWTGALRVNPWITLTEGQARPEHGKGQSSAWGT